jgi:hypothetical protein
MQPSRSVEPFSDDRVAAICTDFSHHLVGTKHAIRLQKESRGIVVFFLFLCARWGWVFNVTPRQIYPLEINSLFILQKGSRAPGLVWTGAEKRRTLTPSAIRTPNLWAGSELLYSLCYQSVVSLNLWGFHCGELYFESRLKGTEL